MTAKPRRKFWGWGHVDGDRGFETIAHGWMHAADDAGASAKGDRRRVTPGAPIQQVGHILLVPGEGDHVWRAGEIAGHATQLFVEALTIGVDQPLPMVVGADVFQ